MELFDLPLVFSQAPLLPADQFERELERRGLWPLDVGHLEELHRTRLLLPLFRLARDVRGAKAAARREGRPPLDYLIYTPTVGWQLRPYVEAGLLRVARSEPFRPWRSYRRSLGEFTFHSSEFLYSPYQLLVRGPDLRDLTRRMRGRRDASGSPRFRLRLFPWDEQTAQRGDDRLVVMLSALEARYRPAIVGRVSLGDGGREAHDQHERDFEPEHMLAWLGLSAPQVYEAGERLLIAADFMDPLSEWWKLIRFGRRDRWDKLKGEALLALDHRIAGEMLLRFHEDLAARGLATAPDPPNPRYHDPRHGRIPQGEAGLEPAVTEFGLSPHPALVLVLEGETEMELVPRALDAFLPPWRSRVRLVNAQGVDANLDLLTAYAGELALGDEHGDLVLLNRPFTRFLIAFDPEGSFATDDQRREKRSRWAAKIQASLPKPLRRSAVVLRQITDLVEVDTWGSAFEYAHFTNGEIAAASNRVARQVNPSAPRILARSVAELRKHGGDVADAWKRAHYKKVTKPAVAIELWPILERKLRAANEAGDISSVALGRVLVRVAELAYLPRHGWALQTRADV